jgi:cellulose synthase/poly-beta-1,6-N-acetylglucosamine synthase-like glycosyltransferase
MTAPLLSVVVIGRNEGERLRRCLESVQAMHRVDWSCELLYVDSASTDASVALAESLGAPVIALHPERPTAALARNAGWTHARGQFILFLDGDTVLHPDFVQSSLPDFADPTVGVVWGHRRELDPQRSLYLRVLDLDWVYAPGLTPFCGGDALFRRAVLEQSGGFDDTLIAGEEPELCRRLLARGWKILHVDRPMTQHDLAITRFSPYWRRATRAGHAFAEVAERFRDTPQPFWSREVRRNCHRALLLAILTAALLGSGWPLLALVVAPLLLALRTAWKVRWKSPDALTLLLYGLHSHFQQIPIFVGQMQFRRNRRRGVRTGLLEYKHRELPRPAAIKGKKG